jgi:hypothetical protein
VRDAGTVRRISTALAVTGLLAGCDKAPTTPTTTPPAVPPQPAATALKVDISGPSRIAPGESAQLTATVVYSDGSTRDVTNDAGWGSVQPDIVSVSATGMATATTGIQFPATDSAGIGAYLHTWFPQDHLPGLPGLVTAQKSVLVMPAGTYILQGAVNDAGAPARAFVVQITAGLGAGTSVERCDIQGKCGGYVFYGLAGPTEIRVIKPGYQPIAKTIVVTEDSRLDFDLILIGPRDDVSGRWTVTATASDDCSAILPQELRTRRYTAVIAQEGSQLAVALEGATFVTADGSGRPTFDGFVDRDGVTLRMTGATIDDSGVIQVLWKVLEQLTPSSLVAVGGYVEARVSSSGISGTMDGEFVMVDRSNGIFRKGATCAALNQRIVLTR